VSLEDFGPAAVYYLAFCRVGACFMFMPGYASPRVPAQVRLFLALAISLSITPLIEPSLIGASNLTQTSVVLPHVAAECATGALIGLVGRLLFAAIQIGGTVLSQVSGFSGMATTDDGSGELSGELGALLSATVLVLLFVMDFHVDVIRALVESYATLPFGAALDPAQFLARIELIVVDTFKLGVRIAGPFILAAVVINFAFGIVNKIAPQIPVVFVSVPFVLAAALWVLANIGPEVTGTIARRTLSLLGAS
jgi:flagellar biosynthesis protein FliR